MGLAREYIDDGTSFLKVNPLSINPGYLTKFSIYEKLPSGTEEKFRFRCLLEDPTTIPKERLFKLLTSWEAIYIHKNEKGNFEQYIKDNIEFILKHKEIDVKEKTTTLTHISTTMIKDVFDSHFESNSVSRQMVEKVENLVARAIEFISDTNSLDGLAELIGHDYDTHTHSVKVGWLMATFINTNRELFKTRSQSEFKDLLIQAAVAGFLHDIGKAKIPKNILNKKGRLDNLEYVMIQSHTAYSVSLLFEADLSRPFMQAILYHHENEDGSGYPCGIAGDQIPVIAKVCHIADVFEALTSRRPYKEPKTPYEALKIMTGANPQLEVLHKFENEVRENKKVPLTAIAMNIEDPKLRRLREKEMLEHEAKKRVEARIKLRDRGMAHCFDQEILKRFIFTIKRSENFNLTSLV